MPKTVLLTRAEGQNARLSDLLTAASVNTLILPMLSIEPCAVDHRMRQVAMDLDRYDHIVFVSRNAVLFGLDLLDQYWPQWPAGLRWHALGEATAAALRQHNIAPRVPAEHSTEGILASGVFDRVGGDKILIVRGVGGREALAARLTELGAEVVYLEVYARRPLTLAEDDRQTLLARRPVVGVVYSGETLEALAANLGQVREGLSLVVPSRRVRNMAVELGFTGVTVAAGTDEAAICEAVLTAID